MRSRTVYDLITLIAEVSGFADLFMISFGFFFSYFYNPKALDAQVMNHMQFSVNSRKKKKAKFQADQPLQLDKNWIADLIKAFSIRVRFEVSDLFLVLTSVIPSRCRSNKTNRMLKLVSRGLDRTNKSLDMKRIAEIDQDVQYLMRKLLGPRKSWLLHR
jgi:hypothetical protein